MSVHSCKESPIILFSVPDGHTKEQPTAGPPKPVQKAKKGAAPEKSAAKPSPAPAAAGGRDAATINDLITKQGLTVRQLKTDKASKEAVGEEVKKLLALKAEFKSVSGLDWKPDIKLPEAKSSAPTPSAAAAAPSGGRDASTINDLITKQGLTVRQLKADKTSKEAIGEEVKTLLALKAEFKSVSGLDWKPDMKLPEVKSSAPAPSAAAAAPSGGRDASTINDLITKQGLTVRQLKADKASKEAIGEEVKTLLALKAEFKSVSGLDWKPDMKLPEVKSEAAPSGGRDAATINDLITKQGLTVRQLKAEKASKEAIGEEVKTLLALKAEFKAVSGIDWKPDMKLPEAKAAPTPAAPTTAVAGASADVVAMFNKVQEQGDKIRTLKAAKAEKGVITAEVQALLSLKAEYKKVAGKDWKPDDVPVASAPVAAGDDPAQKISDDIAAQGDKVRSLKQAKAEKSAVEAEVKTLLSLKAEYKKVSGKDWKPPPAEKAPAQKPQKSQKEKSASPEVEDTPQVKEIKAKIEEQGNKVRSLKASKADKADVDKEVTVLLNLKNELKTLTGAPASPTKAKGKKEVKKAEVKPADDGKKQTRLGLEVKKEDNLSDWYSQVLTKAELIEYYDVSGCYVYRPWSFAMWETIQGFLDAAIKKMGVKNVYFPMFVSKAALEKEKTHISDFAPEVAWVTKSGDSDMAEPVAIRPTSETVMYPSYAKWIRSHRDLPLKLNQWCSVVRWEFKHPQPFIRTREFLWQEGHTAFATKPEAEEEVKHILELYRQIYEDLLAVPVVPGRKTEKEKFAGGDFTTTVEAYVAASGRGCQGGTSHHLGQNFSKMFDIQYEDDSSGDKKFVYQNSWGISTRSIGIMILVHGDNMGLVLPPYIAPTQVVIIPCGITATLSAADKSVLIEKCKHYSSLLSNCNIRVEADYRDNYSPGWKFNHYELKGVPIRLEVGPKDIKKSQFVAVRRDTNDKITYSEANLEDSITALLKTIHNDMFNKVKADMTMHTIVTSNWTEFCEKLDSKCILLSPFCGEESCEDNIKKESAREDVVDLSAPAMGAKSLCSPFTQPGEITANMRCIHPACNNKPKQYTLFGRSY